MTESELRWVLIVIGALVLAAIYYFGRPGRSTVQGERDPRGNTRPWERRDPVLGDALTSAPPAERGFGALDEEPVEGRGPVAESPPLGVRPNPDFDHIVSLHVMAKDGGSIHGAELLVAAEKASLVHGDRGLFHRLVDGRPELGPIFSVINRVKPGSFDLATLQDLRTPGISLFMTLPGPLPALDAWDRMLPAAQRLAELLDADLLDEDHNALGRQRIASIRDELRAYDRKREQREIKALRR
jgi:cell division protein ZipA